MSMHSYVSQQYDSSAKYFDIRIISVLLSPPFCAIKLSLSTVIVIVLMLFYKTDKCNKVSLQWIIYLPSLLTCSYEPPEVIKTYLSIYTTYV